MNDAWETPPDLFDKLNDEFLFEVDLCTNGINSRCDNYSTDIVRFFSEGKYKVFNSFWMNPPYSRGNINKCMEHAYKISVDNKIVVCLVRFDPSAKWFQEWVDGKATEVRMLNKRVKFRGAKDSYNFPCCIVMYLEQGKYRHTETDYYIWGWGDD